jgi:hypothetical protein
VPALTRKMSDHGSNVLGAAVMAEDDMTPHFILTIVRRLRASLATLDARQSMAANHYGIPVFRVS